MEKVARREIDRVIINMPPRAGKSDVATKGFPAWYVGNYPDDEVIISSYGASLAEDFNMVARDRFREFAGELWELELHPSSNGVKQWGIKGRRGGVKAVGAGGPVTGRGARVAIIDDPFKGAEDSGSQTMRDKVWDWYRSVLSTRLTPDGAIVIIQTRWHEDDLAGRVLAEAEENGILDRWMVLSLPALCEDPDTDPLGRKEGEPLVPERGFDRKFYEDKRRETGEYYFAALYQQRPAPADGMLFKRGHFRYYEDQGDHWLLYTGNEQTKRVTKKGAEIFQTCDPAATENESSDWFVLSTWAVTPERDLILLDVHRQRAETVKHMDIMRNGYLRWVPAFQGVERTTYGLNIIQAAKRAGLPIRPLKADRDKVSRARPVVARYELGTVYHPARAPWLAEFEGELLKFPNGSHDDQVDTVSYAGLYVIRKSVQKGRVKVG
ncbi:phage terminase large subunit [Kroppenstedtia guangzhouensis]|nr:phage terminase large subunit [Kroppenstedtia guangzhouensis]